MVSLELTIMRLPMHLMYKKQIKAKARLDQEYIADNFYQLY